MSRALVFLLSLPIWIYQRTISPLLGPTCRFYPSCSSYALISLRQDGLLTAVRKILGRLGRCHPFHPGGYDPP